MTMPFAIPTLADLAPRLTPDDRADMLARVLKTCPDIADNDMIVVHLSRHDISLSQVAGILPGAIDEARAARGNTFRPPWRRGA